MMAQAITQDVIAHDKASKTYDNVGKSVDRLAKQTTQANRRIADANKRTQQSNQDSVRSYGRLTASTGKLHAAFGLTAKGIAVAGVGIAAGLGFAARAGIKTAASMEQAQIGFATLLKSGKKASDFLSQLAKFAAATPFELKGLVDSSRLLIGVGLNTKQTMRVLQDFGDTAGAVGIQADSFQRIMLALSQSIAAGHIKLGDMNQLMNNGLPIWGLLSRAMGKPVAKIQELITKGKLMTADVLPKLLAQMHKDYGGAMAKQSQTLSGLWSTLMDTFNLGLAKTLMPMMPFLKKLATGGIAVLGKAFNGLSTVINTFSTKVGPKVQTAISAMTEGFRNGATSDGATGFLGVFDKIGVVIRKLKDTFAPLVGDAVALIVGAFKKLKDFIENDFLPAAVKVTGWMSDHKSLSRDVVKAILAVIVAYKLLNVAIATATAVQAVYNATVATNPYVALILGAIAVVAALVILYKHFQTFRDIVDNVFAVLKVAVRGWWQANVLAFKAVVLAMRLLARGVLTFLLNPIMMAFAAILHGAAIAFGWIPGVGGKLRHARDAFDAFRAQVNRIIGGITPKKTFVLDAHVTAATRNAFAMYLNTPSSRVFTTYFQTVKLPGGRMAGFASGGRPPVGEVVKVGERGEEYVQFDRPATVYPHGQTPPGGAGGGGVYIAEVHVHGVQSTSQLWQELQKYAKRNGSIRLAGVTG